MKKVIPRQLFKVSIQAAVGDISQSIVTLRSRGGMLTPNDKGKVLSLLERLQDQVNQIADSIDDTDTLLE